MITCKGMVLFSLLSVLRQEQAPPGVLQGMVPQARGHCWWRCLQVLGLNLLSTEG